MEINFPKYFWCFSLLPFFIHCVFVRKQINQFVKQNLLKSDEANRFLRWYALAFIVPLVLLQLFQFADSSPDPKVFLCKGVHSLYSSLAWAIILSWDVLLCWWVWVGKGVEVLLKFHPAIFQMSGTRTGVRLRVTCIAVSTGVPFFFLFT